MLKAFLTAFFAAVFSLNVYAQPMEIVVGSPPGGAVDQFGRMVQQHLSTTLNRPISVLNKSGAEGRVAAKHVLDSGKKETSLLVFTTGLSITPLMYRDPGYRLDDFEYVIPMVALASAIAVRNDLPVKNIQEFAALARRQPINCGASNSASLAIGQYIARQPGLERLQTVPFRGSADLVPQVVGGHIDCALDTVQALHPQHMAGRLRIIALGNDGEESRSLGLGQMSYFRDLLPNFDFMHFYGIAIPKTIPAQERAAIVESLKKMHLDKQMRDALKPQHIYFVQPDPNPQRWLESLLQRFSFIVPKE